MFARTILLATAASLVSLASANAQSSDPNWTGPYIGLNAGGTLDHSFVRSGGALPNNTSALATDARPSRLIQDRDGAEGGGQIGYNRQYGRFVGGLEADIGIADANSSQTYQGALSSGAVQNSYISSKLDYLGTVRARLGYLVTPDLLFYGTGGYAYGDVKYRADFANGSGALAYSGSEQYTASGYAAGAGVEYAYPVKLNVLGHRSAVTLRAEYLHYDLGKKDVNVGAVAGVGAGGYVTSFNTRGDELRGGVNFKF